MQFRALKRRGSGHVVWRWHPRRLLVGSPRLVHCRPCGPRSAEEGFMARIKLAYVGGGSTRAPGTMASFIDQGANFAGSEVVLIDLDPQRLALVQTLAGKLARE